MKNYEFHQLVHNTFGQVGQERNSLFDILLKPLMSADYYNFCYFYH